VLTPATKGAYELLHNGSLCLAAIERRGLKIDTAYLDKAIADTKTLIADNNEQMRQSDVHAIWQKEFGSKMVPGSHEQLGRVIFDCMGFKRNPLAVTGRKDQDDEDVSSNNEVAFKNVDHPFVKLWFETAKLDKAMNTFLAGIRAEVCNGVLHPFIDAHTVSSYRLGSSKPNFQNQPRRNKLIAKIVRSCVVPRPGFVFIKADNVGNEVRESCNYHHDPVFEKYVLGGADMHRDCAKDAYILNDTEIGEPGSECEGKFRDAAKNKMVFPGFYGADYITITPDMWDMISQLELKTAQGVDMFEHLRKKGITSRGRCIRQDSNGVQVKPAAGTFELRIQRAQAIFWERYAVYSQWKRDWWDAYQRDGGFNSLSGFAYRGIFRRNQVLCLAIQGSASHRILWTIIRLHNELIRKKMRSRVVLTIHDDVLVETWESEIGDVIAMITRIATQDIRQAWKWISVPLAMDYSIGRENWFSMQRIVAS
jgi:DNA polymerase I-like protein with 3'-5' exonuclease and polymerase domains